MQDESISTKDYFSDFYLVFYLLFIHSFVCLFSSKVPFQFVIIMLVIYLYNLLKLFFIYSMLFGNLYIYFDWNGRTEISGRVKLLKKVLQRWCKEQNLKGIF